MRILVVDDEQLLVKGIKFNLENEGWQVDACYDGAAAVEAAKNVRYDLIILDLMMPVMDGLEACMHIRQLDPTVPIIMLTAKSEDTDKLLGFEYGADDYITKPFNILLLKARIRALLRRSSMGAVPAEAQGAVLACADFSLDPEKRVARRGDEEVDLTVKEFDVCELLMRSPGKVFSREALLNTVWGYDYQGEERTVDVHIRRLREKLERDPANPAHIVTKWGVGYFFKE